MKLLQFFCNTQEFRNRLENSRLRLFRIAYSWCHESALADDLVQETLEKALKRRGQLRDIEAMNTWLLKILTNCWRDHFRRRKNMVDIDGMNFVSDVTPEDDQMRYQIVSQVRNAIAALPIGQRQVVTLVDLEDCSYVAVADILGVPVGTVMSRLCRARRALRDSLLAVAATQGEPAIPLRRIKS